MSAHTLIQTVLLGLLIVNSVTSQTCSTPFDAAFAGVTDRVVPLSVTLSSLDSQLTFYTEMLGFTVEEANRVMENAIQHFNTQFGIDFSNVEPDETNQRFLPTTIFSPNLNPINFTIVANRWIVSGHRRSQCFPMSIGFFAINFNATTMLHGVYGGEEGIQVSAGDTVIYGHMAIFGACDQQPIVIQAQNNIPGRRTPVEGWIVDEYQLYNRQLGRGRAQSVLKTALKPDDPTMVVVEVQMVFSFP